MSGSTNLGFRHIYGIKGGIAENISFMDNHMVTYVAGHTIVQYSKVDKRQRFIHTSEIVDGITAFTSGVGKKLCAVGERGDRPQAHLFDLRTCRRKKTLIAQDVLAKEFVSMRFSEDNQLLLTLTGAPDYTLMCWNWAKAKLVASLQVSNSPVTRCTFSPIDASIACVTGKDCVKFFRIAERDMRPLQETIMEGTNFTCHAWLRAPEDHCVAGTDTGDLVLFKSSEYVCHIDCPLGPENPVASIISYDGGIVVGSDKGGLYFIQVDASLAELDGNERPGMFTIVKQLQTSFTQAQIYSMCLNEDEDCLAMVSLDNQMIQLPTSNITQLTNDDFSMLQVSFHGPKRITGLDVCVRKPLFATTSKDNTLRIWNYQTSTSELTKNFPEDMFCVALHPSGLHIAVGFTDKLRIYHVLVDELRSCLELGIKGCRECHFSEGGNMLAAVNGNTISIFDFHTGEKVVDLRGHNGKVRNIYWLKNGFQLVSCGQDGAIYLWNLEGKRLGDYVNKGVMYTAVVASDLGLAAVGSDRRLIELDTPELGMTQDRAAETLLTHLQIAPSKSLLFAATGDGGKPGAVRAYQYPMTGEFVEYQCLANHTTMMRMTPDEMFLFMTDEAGTVVVFELRDRQKQFTRNPGALTALAVSPFWTDEALVTRSELEDKTVLIKELRTKVDELKVHIEYQLKLKEMNYSEKIKEVTDKFIQELDQAKTKYVLGWRFYPPPLFPLMSQPILLCPH
jgi:WD40 repeat protein